MRDTGRSPVSPVQPSSSLRAWPANMASIRREICSGDHRNLSLALIYASVRAYIGSVSFLLVLKTPEWCLAAYYILVVRRVSNALSG